MDLLLGLALFLESSSKTYKGAKEEGGGGGEWKCRLYVRSRVDGVLFAAILSFNLAASFAASALVSSKFEEERGRPLISKKRFLLFVLEKKIKQDETFTQIIAVGISESTTIFTSADLSRLLHNASPGEMSTGIKLEYRQEGTFPICARLSTQPSIFCTFFSCLSDFLPPIFL